MKKEKVLKKNFKVFDPLTVDEDCFNFVAGIVKKYGIQGKSKESKVPEEFSCYFNWFYNAYFLVACIKKSEEAVRELEGLNKKFNQVYGVSEELRRKIDEIGEDIKEGEILSITCQKYEKSLKKSSKVTLDHLTSSLSSFSQKLNNLKHPKTSHKQNDSFLSLCYSPDPKILEYKEYHEDSLQELPTQKGNTLENSPPHQSISNSRQRSSKKRCCGFSFKVSN